MEDLINPARLAVIASTFKLMSIQKKFGSELMILACQYIKGQDSFPRQRRYLKFLALRRFLLPSRMTVGGMEATTDTTDSQL